MMQAHFCRLANCLFFCNNCQLKSAVSRHDQKVTRLQRLNLTHLFLDLFN